MRPARGSTIHTQRAAAGPPRREPHADLLGRADRVDPKAQRGGCAAEDDAARRGAEAPDDGRNAERRRHLRVNLGRRATNRTVSVRWARAGVAAGTYTLSLTVVDSRGKALARAARAGLRVRARPRPKPRPKPAPAPSPAPSTGNGVFPVAGGTPTARDSASTAATTSTRARTSPRPRKPRWSRRAPRRSSRRATRLPDRASTSSSTTPAPTPVRLLPPPSRLDRRVGRPVVRGGQRIGAVGTTGDSTGPHLHFELWIGRWFDGGHAVDPLPTLRSWDGLSAI